MPRYTPKLSLAPSFAHTWLTCTAAPVLILDRHDDIPPDKTVWNTEGDMAHAVANAVVEGRKPPLKTSKGLVIDQKKMPEFLKHAEGFKRFVTLPGSVEVKSELNVDLWYMPGRNGYVDAVTFGSATGVSIRISDYKYGQGVAVYAENNEQMAIYARSWAEEYQRSNGELLPDTVFELAIYQPRVRDGEPESVWRLTWEELKAITDEYAETAKRIQARRDLVFRPSVDACRFCKAKTFCEARLNDMGAKQAIVISDTNPNEVFTDLRVFPREALLTIAANKKKLIQFIEDVYSMLRAEAVADRMPEGFKLVRGKGSRSWNDPQRAVDNLDYIIGDEALFSQPKMITPAQAEEKLKALGMSTKFLAPLIKKSEGGVLLVPVDDPRPSIKVDPNDVFDDISEE